ncbi:hypothetical protein [uncultured Corynebacterium sp.]|uniref:hypothetical protein n=1 Tax=uncultured Corynebacterium sp. TaxID=159447 RepID=UPI0025ECCA64|nr:hypothetical protein [uncultured Corynebacterium sp.]
MTEHDRNDDTGRNERDERDEKLGQALDLVKTPFYAWIGAGVRSIEILGDIGARVRAEEESRDGAAADADADATAGAGTGDGTGDAAGSVADRVAEARRRVRDMGDNVSEQSRDAFLKAVDAAQEAFNDALTKAQAGGDRAFATAHTLPDDVAARAEQLQPEQLRAVADGYLEAASRIYRELAARGEQAVDEGRTVAKERSGAFEFGRFPGGRGAGAEGRNEGTDKGGRAGDPIYSLLGKIPFAGGAASRVGGSLEDAARETVKPFQDAGAEFLGRLDQDKISDRVESILHQAADVTEQLLGALRAEEAAGSTGSAGSAGTDAEAAGDAEPTDPGVVDGEVVVTETVVETDVVTDPADADVVIEDDAVNTDSTDSTDSTDYTDSTDSTDDNEDPDAR